jgi:hypothetical protein
VLKRIGIILMSFLSLCFLNYFVISYIQISPLNISQVYSVGLCALVSLVVCIILKDLIQSAVLSVLSIIVFPLIFWSIERLHCTPMVCVSLVQWSVLRFRVYHIAIGLMIGYLIFIAIRKRSFYTTNEKGYFIASFIIGCILSLLMLSLIPTIIRLYLIK